MAANKIYHFQTHKPDTMLKPQYKDYLDGRSAFGLANGGMLVIAYKFDHFRCNVLTAKQPAPGSFSSPELIENFKGTSILFQIALRTEMKIASYQLKEFTACLN